MAMNVGRAPGGPVASINVTPMADIMIVLLIIFMVITPLIRETDGLKLPPASNSRERKESRQDVVVSVRNDTTTFVGTERVDNLGELLLAVQRQLETGTGEHVVLLKADRGLPYPEVEKVIDVCRQAGAELIALIADKKVAG